jgi:hypothetical protein
MNMAQLAAAAVVPIRIIFDFEGAGESRNPRTFTIQFRNLAALLADPNLPQGWQPVVIQGVDGRAFIIHQPNSPSRGRLSHIDLTTFLSNKPEGPEHQALLRLIGTLVDVPCKPTGPKAEISFGFLCRVSEPCASR